MLECMYHDEMVQEAKELEYTMRHERFLQDTESARMDIQRYVQTIYESGEHHDIPTHDIEQSIQEIL